MKSKFGNRSLASMGNYIRVGSYARVGDDPSAFDAIASIFTNPGGNPNTPSSTTGADWGPTGSGPCAGKTGDALKNCQIPSGSSASGAGGVVKDIFGGLFGAVLGGIAGAQQGKILQQQQQLLLAQQQARAKQMQTIVLVGVLGLGAIMLLRRD